MKKFFSEIINLLADNGNWGKGRIQGTYNIPYNLQWVVKILLVLFMFIMLPFFLAFWICKEIYRFICWLFPFIMKAIGWICSKLATLFLWIVALFVAFWRWLKGLFKGKKTDKTEEKQSSRWWLWLLLLLLLLLLGFGLFKSCHGSKQEDTNPQDVPEVVYYGSFDNVVVARAYLDGVQTEVTNDRVLVGLKYVNGEPLEVLKGVDFKDAAYENSILQIAEDWKPVVLESLNPDLQLTEQQMVVITLTAMRMGQNGFPRSTFCKKVNEGKFDEATNWLRLQKADGSLREMGEEATLYFYMLKMLWKGEISVADMADLPMFSYKNLNVEDTTSPTLSPSAREKLRHGNFRTPREALKL